MYLYIKKKEKRCSNIFYRWLKTELVWGVFTIEKITWQRSMQQGLKEKGGIEIENLQCFHSLYNNNYNYYSDTINSQTWKHFNDNYKLV